MLIGVHLILVHKSGSTSGAQTKDDQGIGFHPYFSIKDTYGIFVSLILYGYLIFFNPFVLGHPDNSIPANSLVTPTHIVPE
jgi:ubiquinol-cytochrome c reductase cytochrome b subunit